MNIGFGKIAAALMRGSGGPSQAQLNQQVSTGGGSIAARDSMVNDKRRERSLQIISNQRATQRVALDALKVAAPKKG